MDTTLKATSHSAIFEIPVHPMGKSQSLPPMHFLGRHYLSLTDRMHWDTKNWNVVLKWAAILCTGSFSLKSIWMNLSKADNSAKRTEKWFYFKFCT